MGTPLCTYSYIQHKDFSMVHYLNVCAVFAIVLHRKSFFLAYFGDLLKLESESSQVQVEKSWGSNWEGARGVKLLPGGGNPDLYFIIGSSDHKTRVSKHHLIIWITNQMHTANLNKEHAGQICCLLGKIPRKASLIILNTRKLEWIRAWLQIYLWNCTKTETQIFCLK